jgi:hypothetical protein
MKEICVINSFFNIIAMAMIVYFTVKLYMVSDYSMAKTAFYFIIIMSCSLRIGTDVQLIQNPTLDNYQVIYPLVRNFSFALLIKEYALYKKSKS